MSIVRDDQRGSAAAELTLLVPAVLVLLLFVIFCGRLAEARLDVNDAAHQAVRSATLARTPAQADTDAHTTAAQALTQAGASCRDLSIQDQLGTLRPGQIIAVTVTCHVAASDLAGLDVPGSTTVTATSSSIVDVWRG